MDRFKFHRVVKLLRDLEDKECNLSAVSDRETWLDQLQDNMAVSIALAVGLGVFLFLLR